MAYCLVTASPIWRNGWGSFGKKHALHQHGSAEDDRLNNSVRPVERKNGSVGDLIDALQWLLVSIDGTCAVHRHLLIKNCTVGRQTRNLLQDLLERPIVVKDQFNLVL